MIKVAGSFLAIWFALALVGGLADGTFLIGYASGGTHTGDAAIASEIGQFDVGTAEQGSGGVIGAISGGVAIAVGIWHMIIAWANALSLNFSFFEGPYQPIRWALLVLLAAPMGLELAFRVFGR